MKQGVRLFRAVALSIAMALLISSSVVQVQPTSAQVQPNPIVKDGWVVHWAITADDGLAVYNVTYKGTLVLLDGRLTGILVEYLDHACAFYDEIGSSPPGLNATLEADDISVDARSGGGFNLTANATVPGYTYAQYWVFLPDGSFMALLRISGGGCYDIHVYHPRWRFDFPQFGPLGNNVYSNTGAGWAPVQTESTVLDSGARDAQHDSTVWKIGNQTFNYYMAPFDYPTAQRSPGELVVLAAHAREYDNSHDPATVNPVVYENGERVFRTHIVIWYISSHVHNIFRDNVLRPPITTGLVFYPGGP